jgi:hypothetical protein
MPKAGLEGREEKNGAEMIKRLQSFKDSLNRGNSRKARNGKHIGHFLD